MKGVGGRPLAGIKRGEDEKLREKKARFEDAHEDREEDVRGGRMGERCGVRGGERYTSDDGGNPKRKGKQREMIQGRRKVGK